MKRVPEITADGSSSFYWWIIKNLTTPNMALYKEAKHIFLRNALDEFEGKEKLAFWKWATAHQLERLSEFFFGKRKKSYEINHTAIEKYPLKKHELQMLNHLSQLKAESYAYSYKEFFISAHGRPL